MAPSNHKGDFPAKSNIAAFLKTLGTHDAVAQKSAVPGSTIRKWHATAGEEIGAVQLLRVILAHDAVGSFSAWLRDCAWRKPTIKQRAAAAALLTSAQKPRTGRRASGGE